MQKKWSFILLGVGLVGMVLSAGEVEAKKAKKIVAVEKPRVIVAAGTPYKIADLYKYDKGGAASWSKMVRKKKIKWSSKSKSVKIKGKKIVIRKNGTYELIGTLKKKRYVIPLEVMDAKWKMDTSQVAYAQIRHQGDLSNKITDPAQLSGLYQVLGAAGLTFDFELANRRLIGWEYSLSFYRSDGTEVAGAVVSDRRFGYYSCKSGQKAIDYAYIVSLFNQYFIPEPNNDIGKN